LFGASRYNIPGRNEMISEIQRLNGEIKEKEKFLSQGNNSVKEFIKDKIGVVSYLLKLLGSQTRKIRDV
jgi:hypothetical protein